MEHNKVAICIIMVITGSVNILAIKWADSLKSEGSDGTIRKFQHPFVQTCAMFAGESLCLVVYKLVNVGKDAKIARDSDNTEFNTIVYYPAALMDMTASSLQYMALNLTYASSVQMLRGGVIVFTALLSKCLLYRTILRYRWCGIALVIVGLMMVSISDVINPSTQGEPLASRIVAGVVSTASEVRTRFLGSEGYDSSKDVAVGDLLTIISTVITASQVVYEEKFINKYGTSPLVVVGLEGIYGFITMAVLLVPMYYIPVGDRFSNNPRHVLEDAVDGFYQLINNDQLMLSYIIVIISVSFYNFAGITVTKNMSAITRMMFDSMRSLVIWSFSLIVGWQQFYWIQLAGFVVAVGGMCLYNGNDDIGGSHDNRLSQNLLGGRGLTAQLLDGTRPTDDQTTTR